MMGVQSAKKSEECREGRGEYRVVNRRELSPVVQDVLVTCEGTNEVLARDYSALLTLARSLKPPLGSVPSACVLVSPLYINRL